MASSNPCGKLISSSRQQSFSEVILENLRLKPRTCGELLEELERDFDGARLFDPKRIEQIRAARGRRSNGFPY